MKPMISVIIPIYNSEKYLNECVDSILNQTVKEIECILVDDGSTDSSSKICDEYAKADDRVRVIHQKNARIGAARNAGINIASGEYITFIDSDDRLELNAYEIALKYLKDAGADMIQWDVQYFFSENYMANEVNKERAADDFVMIDTPINTMHHMYDLKTLQDKFNNIGLCTHCVWTKLCKSELFDGDIRFPVNKEFEDEFMTTQLYTKAKKIVTINKRFSNYRLRPTSTIHTMPINGRANKSEAVLERLKFVLNTEDEQLKQLAVSDFVVTITGFYMAAAKANHSEYKKESISMSDVLKDKRHYMNTKTRMAYELFRLSPSFVAWLFQTYQCAKSLLKK